jgi:hypothetical protein
MTDVNKKGIGGIIDDILGDSDDDKSETSTSGQKGGVSQQSSNEGRGWHGDPQGHSEAASKANRTSSQRSSGRTGSKGGSSRHRLTDQDRSKGGKVSASKQDMSELGRRGGRA